MDVEQQKINFVKRVLIDQPEKCWFWTGGKTTMGYGIFPLGMRHKKEYAHRAAIRLFKGEDTSGQFVLHSCDNPSCVNPDHLRLGLHKENAKDAKDRKRFPTGERHHAYKHGKYRSDRPKCTLTKSQLGLLHNIKGEDHCCAKLSEHDVRNIRQLIAEGCAGVDIANEFKVKPSTICDIKARRTWRHLE